VECYSLAIGSQGVCINCICTAAYDYPMSNRCTPNSKEKNRQHQLTGYRKLTVTERLRKYSGGQAIHQPASLGGHGAVVQMLLEHKDVNVNATDSKSRSSLLWAAMGGHCAAVRLLLEHRGLHKLTSQMLGHSCDCTSTTEFGLEIFP